MSQQRIVLATSNKGKLAEFNDLFSNFNVKIQAQSEFNLEDAEETGTTFVENAIIKARHAATVTGLPCIADDSGLSVAALGGAPGIYSSRYAGDHGNNEANNSKLLRQMHGIEKRQAFFICVLVYMQNADDPTPIICQAKWDGQIATELLGTGGFGYDPLFYLPEHACSAAELAKGLKNRVSHRAQALKLLLAELRHVL